MMNNFATYITATSVSPIVIDVETCGLPNAAEFLEPVQPAKNLKDPEKIKADIEQRTTERNEKIALDWNVGRIAALAWWTEQDGMFVSTCENEQIEGDMLRLFWQRARNRTIVGFGVKAFDLRFMVQRSRYLGVTYPMVEFSKYSHRGVEDLHLMLTFGDGPYDQGCMRRTLHAFCKRFGLPVHDDISGKDIPALVEAGDWKKVETHVRSDVELTVALARKLGVLQPTPEAVVAAVAR